MRLVATILLTLAGVVPAFSLATPAELVNRWQGPCREYNPSFSQIQTVTFTERDEMKNDTEIFWGKHCETLLYTTHENATIRVGNAVAKNAGARELDTALVWLSVEPVSELAVRSFNHMQYCGISQWTLGVEEDVAGRTCKGEKNPPLGLRVYTIYSIQGDYLYFGANENGLDGTSPQNRPNNLALMFWLKRQP